MVKSNHRRDFEYLVVLVPFFVIAFDVILFEFKKK